MFLGPAMEAVEPKEILPKEMETDDEDESKAE
jgi:hypothetical protein